MKLKRKLVALLGVAVTLSAVLASVSVVAAGGPGNPQVPSDSSSQMTSDVCLLFSQLRAEEQEYRNVNNTPFTYGINQYGVSWFNVACGSVTFTVPAGQQALVDLVAAAELDCQSTEIEPNNAWCTGRFYIYNSSPARPDNSGRIDSFAWDSANGGSSDWQAHTLHQVYRANCIAVVPCIYTGQLQSRFENGATSLWVDDLTLSVTVIQGTVTVTTGAPTP